MRARNLLAASLFSTLIFIHPVAAQVTAGAGRAAAHPELQPLRVASEVAALPEPLDAGTLARAAVAFSGTASDHAAATEAVLAHARSFRAHASRLAGQRWIAEAALEYLHENVLKVYAEYATSVDEAVRTGRFNCVSSAVLYSVLARSAGLEVSGVRTKDHAFVSVVVDGTPVDVETTNVHGFEPGKKKEFTDSFGAVTGYAYVPPSNYRDRTTIGLKELLALILYNRASEAAQQGRYLEALNPAVSSYALTGTADFREAMRVALSNQATSLAMSGAFAEALGFLDEAEAAWGPEPDLDRLRMEVTHNQLISLVERGALDQADALLRAPGAPAVLGENDWRDLSVYVVQERARAAVRQGGDAAGAETVAAGIAGLGKEPELLRMYEAYVHNAFARLFNARRFDEARAVLARGLEVHPSSAMLARDKATLDGRPSSP
jgi:tetratricopeptide (TPR) repeat protein